MGEVGGRLGSPWLGRLRVRMLGRWGTERRKIWLSNVSANDAGDTVYYFQLAFRRKAIPIFIPLLLATQGGGLSHLMRRFSFRVISTGNARSKNKNVVLGNHWCETLSITRVNFDVLCCQAGWLSARKNSEHSVKPFSEPITR